MFDDRWKAATDAMISGVFDPQGMNWFDPSGLGATNNLASNFDNIRAGLGTTSFQKPAAKGSANSLGGNIANEAVTMAVAVAAPEVAAAKIQTASDQKIELGFWDQISNYFGRGIIIVLGFIFVAVGLSMFKIIPMPPIIPKVPT